MFPADRITKLDLARYYERIAPWLVPHVAGRPLTLVRCPKGLPGGCFFMKHDARVAAPEPLRRVPIAEKQKTGNYLVADDAAGVVALVQLNVVELHTWNALVDRLEQPDRLVFDIDPGPDVPWRRVVAAALAVRDVLQALRLASFVKTTGGSGLHVVVPLVAERGWDDCLAFARAIAEALEARDPANFTTAYARAGRAGKILIDYLRNSRANTSVAAYSTRATDGAPVSTPLAWDELGPSLRPQRFTLATIPKRLGDLKRDPWQDYWRTRQKIGRAAFSAAVSGLA